MNNKRKRISAENSRMESEKIGPVSFPAFKCGSIDAFGKGCGSQSGPGKTVRNTKLILRNDLHDSGQVIAVIRCFINVIQRNEQVESGNTYKSKRKQPFLTGGLADSLDPEETGIPETGLQKKENTCCGKRKNNDGISPEKKRE